jgi:hypothetical protein
MNEEEEEWMNIVVPQLEIIILLDWMNEEEEEWMNEWMNEWFNEWMHTEAGLWKDVDTMSKRDVIYWFKTTKSDWFYTHILENVEKWGPHRWERGVPIDFLKSGYSVVYRQLEIILNWR